MNWRYDIFGSQLEAPVARVGAFIEQAALAIHVARVGRMSEADSYAGRMPTIDASVHQAFALADALCEEMGHEMRGGTCVRCGKEAGEVKP